MKKSFLNNCLIILLVICTSFIAFFAFNLLTSMISNYESINQYTISGIPMFMLYGTMVTMIVFIYRFYRNQKMDFYMIRRYTLIIAIMSLIGLIFAIIISTPLVYGSVLTESVFKGYPLVMIIILSLFLLVSLYFYIMSNILIKRDNLEKPAKGSAKYRAMTFGIVFLLTYALGRLGALLYLPIYWSPTNSLMLIPFYIQLVVPILLIIFRLIYIDFNQNRKFSVISSGILFGYSLLSMGYTLLIVNINKTGVIQALSPIFQIERLVCLPVDFVAIYLVGICLPLVTFIVSLIKLKKEKKNA